MVNNFSLEISSYKNRPIVWHQCLLAFLIFVATGCTYEGVDRFYKPNLDATAVGVQLLAEDGEPVIIHTENIDHEKERYQNMGYVVMGQSDFEKRQEDKWLKRTVDSEAHGAYRYAKKILATHVLYHSESVDQYSQTTSVGGNYDNTFYEVKRYRAIFLVKKK